MTFVNPQYLVETDWLEAHLTDPDLRVLDCTVLFDRDEHGRYLDSGRETWAQGHIPGSGFADLMSELVDQEKSPALHDATRHAVRRGHVPLRRRGWHARCPL